MNVLEFHKEFEQVSFVSDEVQHGIDYNDNNVKGVPFHTQMDSFLGEDNKVMPTIQQPFCRLNRH